MGIANSVVNNEDSGRRYFLAMYAIIFLLFKDCWYLLLRQPFQLIQPHQALHRRHRIHVHFQQNLLYPSHLRVERLKYAQLVSRR